MERIKEKILLRKLLEINSDYMRGLRKEDKTNTVRILIEDILKWSTFTNYDAVGVLDVVKQHFIINADEVREEEPKQLRIAKRYI
jgi:hypothetical protein